MDRSRRAGVSSPQQGHVRAGIAGDEPMVMLRGRLMRIGFILGLLLMLTSAASIDPQAAIARPAPTDGVEGTPTGNGDPTGDDVPSPTPKPTIRLTRSGPTAYAIQARGIRWSVLVSILIRLGIR